ncbi:tryptophan dimethylallyltransferase family protein [Candidatus Tisiphia endosymbiont of Mystacides longicornis]|uniref:tryptophan dimethylallyltransferase family protein n=1 Tax=Candidatus Tisiphia endosymbiont of Mystacides longicornis TaxID=3139330 RepID=UPI003CCA888D
MKDYFMLTTKLLLVLCLLILNTLAQSFEYNEPTTLGYAARNKLKKVYQAIGLAQEAQEAIKVLDLLTESWSRYDTETRWANNLTGDLCPLEFSLTFKGNEKLPVVRFLIEPQESPFTIQSSWKVGLELKEKLKVLPGVDVSRFDKIYPIFLHLLILKYPQHMNPFRYGMLLI